MPIKFRIKFKLKKPKHILELSPDRIHALFLSLFPRKIAEELHKPAPYRPFSIWFPEYFRILFSTSSENERFSPFITHFTLISSLLKEEYFSPLIANILEKKYFFLGDTRVEVVPYTSSFIKEEAFLTYEELLEKAVASSTFSFLFKTPTVFKRGKIDYPLPDPQILFKNLIRKWHYFSEIKVKADLNDCLIRKLQISYFKLKIRRVKLSLGGVITGFTGRVSFVVKEGREEELKWLCVLGSFATFSGTGRKTTMGLGMTDFASNIQNVSDNLKKEEKDAC